MLKAQHDDNFVQIKSVNTKNPRRSSASRQLNVWVKKDTKVALAQQANLEQRPMAAIVEELIQRYTSHQQADLVESQSLPLIREVVVTEIRKALAQHRLDLAEDMRIIILEAIKLCILQSNEQLAHLIGRTARLGVINRRLILALMTLTYGEEISAQADEEAARNTSKQTPSHASTKKE